MIALLSLQIFGTIIAPPARYDHPYKPGIVIIWKDYSEVARICRNPRAAACSIIHPGKRCIIIANKGYRGTWMDPQIVRHERAHCNGWPASHPQ